MFESKRSANTDNAACIYGISVTNWANTNNAPPLISKSYWNKKFNVFLSGEEIGVSKQF